MSDGRVYLDHAASAPLLTEAREAMFRAADTVGNPSALHSYGREARAVIDDARSAVAELVGAEERDVVFTSGASESNALGVLSYLRAVRKGHDGPLRAIVSPLEHASMKAAFATAASLYGLEVDIAPVGKDGIVDVEGISAMIRRETVLVSVLWVNNVFGAVQPIAAIGAAVRSVRTGRGKDGLPIVFMTDAVQGVGLFAPGFQEADVDMMTVSAHKIGGPKGTGALVVRDGIPFATVIGGGRHERNRRGGTENLQGIAGFGAAAAVTVASREETLGRMRALKQRLLDGLYGNPGLVRIIGDDGTSPHIAYALFRQEGDYLAVSLDVEGIAVSSGSACDTGTRKTSDVLSLVCDAGEAARGGVRFSLGRSTTEADIDRALAAVRKVAAR